MTDTLGKIINSIGLVLMNTISWLYGPLDGLLVGAAFFALVDVITGMVGAWSTGTYDSSKFSLKKKIGIFVAIAVMYRLDQIIPTLKTVIPALGDWAMPFRDFCIGIFIVNDVTSIFENLGLWGVRLPKAITSHLAQLKDKVNQD